MLYCTSINVSLSKSLPVLIHMLLWKIIFDSDGAPANVVMDTDHVRLNPVQYCSFRDVEWGSGVHGKFDAGVEGHSFWHTCLDRLENGLTTSMTWPLLLQNTLDAENSIIDNGSLILVRTSTMASSYVSICKRL